MNVLRHIGSRTFQSTLPLRGATPSNAVNNASSDFNPHSPCGERLRNPSGDRSAQRDFNPHSPCGERHSVRRARPLHAVISIHTPLAGSDVFGGIVLCEHAHISIHTPLAGSDRQPADHAVGRHISIHTPLAGSDRQCRVDGETLGISIHTPLAGSDHAASSEKHGVQISIHTPLAGSD